MYRERPYVPEIKVEGVPYRAAKAGAKADPGEVQITCSVAEAQAIACVLGHGVGGTGGVHETSSTWGAPREAVGYGPFKWVASRSIDNGFSWEKSRLPDQA